MSSTQETTSYAVQLDIEGQGGSVFAQFNLPTQMGFGDQSALELVHTLKDFPWPAGASVNVQVSKTTDTLISYQGRLDLDPPAFV
ncbi:hypothetical protein AB0N99_30980 [Streptomyces sp. NPDC093272]|uniref:hypothetical protein n=1 Tax=Streptomyces sp. NPDC093272 TaxID=3154981 RepID=UPI0034218E75